MAYFRAFCKVGIIRDALRKARFSCIETYLLQKMCQHQFSKEDITTEVQEYYASMPKVYLDFNGDWQPHIVFVGEIIEVRDER